jgi:DNA ligase (NAD+)
MSTLTGVTVQVGRLGTLTPVAELEPVTIGGVKVSRASLHNSDELVRLGLRLGDVVRVARAGDVIPKVLERVSTSESGERVAMPDRCPSCGGPVLRKEDEAALRCVAGYKCPKQVGLRS